MKSNLWISSASDLLPLLRWLIPSPSSPSASVWPIWPPSFREVKRWKNGEKKCRKLSSCLQGTNPCFCPSQCWLFVRKDGCSPDKTMKIENQLHFFCHSNDFRDFRRGETELLSLTNICFFVSSQHQKTIYRRLSEDKGYLLNHIRGQSVCYCPAGFSGEVRICLSLSSFSFSAWVRTEDRHVPLNQFLFSLLIKGFPL